MALKVSLFASYRIVRDQNFSTLWFYNIGIEKYSSSATVKKLDEYATNKDIDAIMGILRHLDLPCRLCFHSDGKDIWICYHITDVFVESEEEKQIVRSKLKDRRIKNIQVANNKFLTNFLKDHDIWGLFQNVVGHHGTTGHFHTALETMFGKYMYENGISPSMKENLKEIKMIMEEPPVFESLS